MYTVLKTNSLVSYPLSLGLKVKFCKWERVFTVHSSDLMCTFEGETPAWDASSFFMNVSYVCTLFCHCVNPSTSFLLLYACVGKKQNRNLHLCYTPEILGVTCVFQKTFPFFSSSVHCLSDKFRCLWHICMKGEEGENYLSFGSL